MIDAYAAAGTFPDSHALARDLAKAVMAIERVPDIALFRKNTAAFVHELPPDRLSNVDGDHTYVRVQVLTNAGALDRDKQLALVAELTRIVASAANDPTLAERTWVLLTEAPDGRLGSRGSCPHQRGARHCRRRSTPQAMTLSTALGTESVGIVQELQPFDVAWRTIDGLGVRYTTNGSGSEKIVLFSPWPESIFAFAPVWGGLTKQFEVLAIDLPGFGRSEARDDLFAPQKMGEFIVKAIEAFGLTSVHAVGLDVGSPSVLFAALERRELFRSLIVGAGASTYPLVVEGALKWMIEAEPLPPMNGAEVVGGFLASIRWYAVPRFVRDDYLASYDGDRLTRSAALVRAYPKDLAALAPRLSSIQVPVAIVVGRNDPYGLARDAALLREQLPHARLDVLEAGHCVWEERAPEFESIVRHWVTGNWRD